MVRSADSCSAKNAISSGVPAVTRSAVGAPNAPIGPDDHTAPQQRVVQRSGIVSDLDEDEVRDGRPDRSHSLVSERRLEGLHRLAVEAARRARARPRRRGSRAPPPAPAVVTSNARRTFLIAVDHAGRADPVADAQPGEPVDLRERAQDEHPVPRLRVLLDRVGVVGLVDVLEVRLVDDVRTCSGTPAKYASSSSRAVIVPVGLFGVATKTIFVRGVTALEQRLEVEGGDPAAERAPAPPPACADRARSSGTTASP